MVATPSPPPRPNPARTALGFLLLAASAFGLFLLIPLFLFARPYPHIRDAAAAYDVAPNCRDASSVNPALNACLDIEGYISGRYYRKRGSHNTRSYAYFVRVGPINRTVRTIEVKDEGMWWRLVPGSRVQMQVWEDRVTLLRVGAAVTATAENPNWQLDNDLDGLKVIGIGEGVSVFLAAVSFVGRWWFSM